DRLRKQCSVHERILRARLYCDQTRGWHGTQTRSRLAGASDTIRNRGARWYTFAARRFRRRQRDNEEIVVLEFQIRSSFRYRPAEQACCKGRCELGIHALPARRLTEYRYPVRIAAKARDVIANPLERELLIHQPIVAIEMAFGIYRGLGKESQIPEAVIDRDDDHSFFHQLRGVVDAPGPSRQPSAMNPDHHRQAAPPAVTQLRMGRINIQEQA